MYAAVHRASGNIDDIMRLLSLSHSARPHPLLHPSVTQRRTEQLQSYAPIRIKIPFARLESWNPTSSYKYARTALCPRRFLPPTSPHCPSPIFSSTSCYPLHCTSTSSHLRERQSSHHLSADSRSEPHVCGRDPPVDV